MLMLWSIDKVEAVKFASNEFSKLQTVLTELGKNCCFESMTMFLLFVLKSAYSLAHFEGCYQSEKCELKNVTINSNCPTIGAIRCDGESGLITEL